MAEDNRFVRWQSILRDQLSFTNNLLLAFSFTTLGFQLIELSQATFSPSSCQKIFFTGGLLAMFSSLVAGIAVALNRLADFRTTVKNLKAQKTPNNENLILELRQQSEIYGDRTWCWIKIQAGTFLLGSTLLAVAYLIIFSDKLF